MLEKMGEFFDARLEGYEEHQLTAIDNAQEFYPPHGSVFRKPHMQIREYTRYDPAQILPLYESVGWTAYTKDPAALERGFAHSLLILAAYEQDRLIGILRAVGDGETIVLIQDLLVHPDHQRKGVGSALMRTTLDRFSHVRQIELMADETKDAAAFYGTLGFQRMSDVGCCGFIRT